MNTKIARLKPQEKPKGTYRYAQLVLAAYDDQEHAVKREQKERKAEAEREARQRI